MSLPKTMANGVSNSSAQASRSSNHRISRKAPQSWIPVITICGSVSAVIVVTCSMSLASREVMSPECSSSPVNSCLRNRLLKICRRRAFDWRTLAAVVNQKPTCRSTTPPTTVSTSSATILSTSSAVPVRIVSSMKRRLSHTISRPSTTCPIPVTMRTAMFQRMPRALCQSQTR